jgi:hypothetical protein
MLLSAIVGFTPNLEEEASVTVNLRRSMLFAR